MDENRKYIELTPIKETKSLPIKTFWLPLIGMLIMLVVILFLFYSMYNITSALSSLKQEVNMVDKKEITMPLAIPKSLEQIKKGLSLLSEEKKTIEIEQKILSDCTILIDLILEITELQTSLRQGKPYATPLAKISLLTKGNEQLAKKISLLQQNANIGVLNNYQLKHDLSKITNDLVASYNYKDTENKWVEKGKLYLSNIISIRKIGNRAKNDGGVDEAIIEINTALEEDNLPRARAILASLPNLRSVHVQNWLKKLDDNINMQETTQYMLNIIKQSYKCNNNHM